MAEQTFAIIEWHEKRRGQYKMYLHFDNGYGKMKGTFRKVSIAPPDMKKKHGEGWK